MMSRETRKDQFYLLKINWDNVMMKYPVYTHKTYNIRFLLENIEFRLNALEDQHNSFFKYIDENLISLNVEEPYNINRILDNKGINPELNICPDDKYWNCYHSMVVPNELLYEFYSYISLLISYIDNIIDLNISIKYEPKPKDKHWNLTDYLKRKHRKLIFQDDEIFNDILIANDNWLADMKHHRNLVAHQIPEIQKVSFLILRHEPDRRYLGKIDFDNFGDSIFAYSCKQLESTTNLSEIILKSIMKRETISGSWVKYHETLEEWKHRNK